MWKISKFFQIPLNDPRMQDINTFDLDFYELSMIADDPKKLEQLQNQYYDPEFDEWLDEFDAEQEEKQSSQDDKFDDSPQLESSGEENIEHENKNHPTWQESASERYEDYEESIPTDEISDWEEVN